MAEQDAVPEDVIEALEDVRASGATNMFDRRRVLFELEMRWLFGVVTWLERHPKRYMDALTEMGERRRQAQD